MKTNVPIVIAISVLQVALGIDIVCHLATLGDDSWSQSKCWCSQIDGNGNEKWYTDKYDFAEGCEELKPTQCNCTEKTTARFGGDVSVLTWVPGEADEGTGSPILVIDQ